MIKYVIVNLLSSMLLLYYICVIEYSNKQYIRNVNNIYEQAKKYLLILKINLPTFLFKYCLNIEVINSPLI